ncbi:MAG TPA: hypothetical protein VHT91_13445 [Kofleriaceae bacterium]|nr:hypothetical protein [Kofleriaceae bacterium]
MLRSLSAAVLALAIGACEPDLPQVTPPPTVTAVFDPTAAKIPLPNDLVFIAPLNSVCPAPANGDASKTPMCAQAELLASFNGKFPSDQEVPLTIDFTENTYDNGRLKPMAPALDLSTVTPATLFVIGPTGPVALETPTADDYVIPTDASGVSDHGTLSIHHKDHLPWPTGGYVLVMRGGDMGVKTLATADSPAIPVTPSPVFDLIEQGKDLTLPENIGLLKAQNNGSTMDALAQAVQLNLLIGIYKNTAFPAADAVFPHEQMAIASTFQIDTTVTNVEVDPARGLAPLPFDLLRDPTSHKLTPTAACALLGSKLDKTGACPNPAAAGFLTLDGFSTTGAILAPTSDLIDGATVTSSSLRLYDLTDPKNPALVTADPPLGALIIEPCEFTAQFNGTICDTAQPKLAPAIAAQPAGATNGDPSSVFRSRPLKDNTDYAVVMTTDIKDKAGKAIGPGTVAKILRFTNPLSVGGHSALQGIDDTTALSLDTMRKQLIPVFTKLGPDATKVATAYTFHTQSVVSPATDLGAFPYSLPAITAQPDKTSLTFGSATDAFTKYGVVPTIPSSNIDEILEVNITTFNLLDPSSGAFFADPKLAAAEPIHVLIATPKPGAAPNCPGAPDPRSAFTKCAPLMVFRHGLGGGRAQMLLIADAFAAAGMVTVAIDAAKHGDRSLCLSAAPSPQSGCNGACTPLPMAAGQGDTAATGGPPGTCDSSGLVKVPVTPGATGNTDGIAKASGNYLISANFFRTRDSLRQDLIDQSQLVRAIAFVPTGPPPSTNAVFDHIVTHAATTTGTTMIIDPGTVYFSGQSLGAIQGTMDVATNSRISKAGLNVGGGTLVDIFSNSPAFATAFNQLLAGLGITKGTPQYLQFLTVAKTILDPADPVNFAGHLTANTLPDLLANPNRQVPQAAKKVLIQVANCDQVVPNPFGLVWSSTLAFANPASPVGPLPNTPAFFAPGSTGTFQLFAGKNFNPADFGNPTKCNDGTAAGNILVGQPPTPSGGHGFLLSFERPDLTLAAQANLASFMMTGNPVPSVVLSQ